MSYEPPLTAAEIQETKKSTNVQAFVIIGLCVVIGAASGLAIVSGVGQSGKKTTYAKKQDRGQSFVNWLIGSDSKSKKKSKRGKSSYSRYSNFKPIRKQDMNFASPFAKPRSTIILD